MNGKWVRTPKHILRWSAIEDFIRDFGAGSFVEFGAGTGDFTRHILDRGYNGVCYDIGEENRKVLRENLSTYAEKSRVADSLNEIAEKAFDYLFAFEVLEHIENDLGALQEWTKFLKPGGRAVISVPAHQKKFGAEDEFVGHWRRYEKDQLVELMESAGFLNLRIINYGFPLGNITSLVKSVISTKRELDQVNRLSKLERAQLSGVRRSGLVAASSFLFNESLLRPFCLMQRAFYNSDLGDGYVITGMKK